MILSDWLLCGVFAAVFIVFVLEYVCMTSPLVGDNPNFDTEKDSAYMIDGKITQLNDKD